MVAVTVLAAVGAAFCNALAAVLQQGAAKRLEGREGIRPRQFVTLVRQRRWLAGQASDTSAFVLQAVALSFGALLLVQPLLVLALPFGVVLRAAFAREWPQRRALRGVGLCVLGLGAFLALARPKEAGRASLEPGEALAMGIALAVLLTGFMIMASLTRRNLRAVAFALAATSLYGVTAGLTKVATGQLAQGVVVPLQHWELYAAIVTGLTGVVLTQNALEAGALAAPVAVLTLGDPLVGLAIGLLWLGETITSTPWAIGGELAAVAVITAGVVVLARQSPAVAAPTGDETADTTGDPG